MSDPYKSQYYPDTQYFINNGWSQYEINVYFPILESLDNQELLDLHALCHAKMFKKGEAVDKEQAIHVVLNPNDTPKERLVSALFVKQCEKYIVQKEKGELSIEEIGGLIIWLETEGTFVDDPIFDLIFGDATDLEMPREMSIGAGINIGDKWTQEFVEHIREARDILLKK